MATTNYTYTEILQQPKVWKKEYEIIFAHQKEISTFLKTYLLPDCDLILTGAGTSAFIGDALVPALVAQGLSAARSVATTDIITHPRGYLNPQKKTVLLSFARSGNSPESVATVEIANRVCKDIAHIIITCNADGALARMRTGENTLVLLLPEETNDKSLAMTSSFSTMMLAALLCFNIDKIERLGGDLEQCAAFAQSIIDKSSSVLEQIASRSFLRAIFLGSGELKGVAEECHLKLQELTDGGVVCKYDSFLGFRHGPKAVINSESVIVYLMGSGEYIQRYEADLIRQINSNNSVVAQIVIAPNKVEIEGVRVDAIITPDTDLSGNIFALIPYVLVGQLFGYYKSINCGLEPDSPSRSGNIARVVEGVHIYECKI